MLNYLSVLLPALLGVLLLTGCSTRSHEVKDKEAALRYRNSVGQSDEYITVNVVGVVQEGGKQQIPAGTYAWEYIQHLHWLNQEQEISNIERYFVIRDLMSTGHRVKIYVTPREPFTLLDGDAILLDGRLRL